MKKKNIIGYIKFVDNDFIENFYELNSLWLSEISAFTENSEEVADNLIDDPHEGKLENISLDMPAFITCFTELTSDSFDKDGILNKDISDALIKCEEKLHKNRDFIFIPSQNMQSLLDNINNAQHGETEGELSHTKVFARKVLYKADYSNKMRLLEEKFWAGNASMEEDIGKAVLQTKDERYKPQNEFRIGVVLQHKKEEWEKKHKNVKGLSIKLVPSIHFAKCRFKRESLRTLSTTQLQ